MRIAFWLWLMVSGILYAQDCTFTFCGNVYDFHDGTPLAHGTIKIEKDTTTVITDENGFFKLENQCTSSITVKVTHDACEPKTVILKAGINCNTIYLEHHLESLETVTVTGTTSKKESKSSIEQKITSATIHDLSAKPLGDILKTLPGVTTLNTGNGIVKPMIHGMHSSRLLIINDNVRLFDQEWGEDHAPSIDANTAAVAKVILGSHSLKYGSDAIGGVVVLEPKRFARKDSLFGQTIVSGSSNGRGVLGQASLTKTSKNGFFIQAQGNYKRFGDFKSPDYYLTNTGLNAKKGSFRTGFQTFEKGVNIFYSYVDNEIGILKASHIGNTADLIYALNNQSPSVQEPFSYSINTPRQQIQHHLGKLQIYKRYANFGKINLQYDFQLNRRKEFDTRRGDKKNIPVVDLRLITHSFQPSLLIDALDDFKIGVGTLFRYQNNEAVAGTGTRPLIPYFDLMNLGVYGYIEHGLNDRLNLDLGLRYDYTYIKAKKFYRLSEWQANNYNILFPQFERDIVDLDIWTIPEFKFHNFSGSFGLNYDINDHLEYTFNYGLASRTPNPSEFFSDGLHHAAARIEIGDLSFDKEIAHKFMMNLNGKFNSFGFTISPYISIIDNYIQLIPEGARFTIRGQFSVWKYHQNNANILGVDVNWYKTFNTHWNYTGEVSWLRGTNTTDDIPLIHMPATNFRNTITYTDGKKNPIQLGLTHQSILKQNRFPDYNFDAFEPVSQQYQYVDISSTPSGYTLFNFNGSYTHTFANTQSIKIGLTVENILNTRYRNYLNRLRYFADESGRNISIQLHYNF